MGQIATLRTNAFILGSADVLVGDDELSLVSLGPANGIKFEESFEEIKMEIDNYGEEIFGIKNQQVKVSGGFLEIDLEKFADVRGGIDLYTTVAASKVSDATQSVPSGTWEFNKFIEITHQNGDGTILQIDATGHVNVTGSVDGPLTVVDDFDMVQDNAGKWGIIVKDSATVTTEDQALTIAYDYTPAATKKLTSGGLKTIASKVVQLKHTTSDGKEFKITLYKAKNTEGMKIDFPADAADKAAEIPFTFTGTCDGSRTVGDQLYKMEDTRSY